MSVKFPTVDADGHLEEVHINWKERVPEKYRAMAPERRPASDSHLRLTLEALAETKRTRSRRWRTLS
jgi:hypothetical protein